MSAVGFVSFGLIVLTSLSSVSPTVGNAKEAIASTKHCYKLYPFAFLSQNARIMGRAVCHFKYPNPILATMGDIQHALQSEPKLRRIRIPRLRRLSQLTQLRAGIDSANSGRFDPISNPVNTTAEIATEASPPRGSRRNIVCQNTLAQV